MNRTTRLTNSPNIIVFVQGWMGSIETNLFQSTLHHIANIGFDYWAFDFKGHSLTDPQLPTISEMVETLYSELKLLSLLYPEKRIILMGHSQGCVVIYRYLRQNSLAIPTLFMTPAFDIKKIIIESRLTETERSTLRRKPLTKEFRKNTFKVITPQWLLDYESQDYSEKLLENTAYYAVFGKDDPIIDYDVNKKIFDYISHNSPSIIVNGDHIFSQNMQDLFKVLEEFLSIIEQLT